MVSDIRGALNEALSRMNFSEVELPSNRKFGFFFCVFFTILSFYFYMKSMYFAANIFLLFTFMFLVITIIKADLLLVLNKSWMRFGLLIGMIVSPIVLGFIFYIIFTPIALLMRLFGRDELSLRSNEKKSYWIARDESNPPDAFNHQF